DPTDRVDERDQPPLEELPRLRARVLLLQRREERHPHRLRDAGEELPHPRAHPPRRRELLEARGRVVRRIGAEGDELERLPEVLGASLHLSHLLERARARAGAAGEEEARQPDLPAHLRGTEGLAQVTRRLERRQRAVYRKRRRE